MFVLCMYWRGQYKHEISIQTNTDMKVLWWAGSGTVSIWKVGWCDITWYIPYWLVYTTFVISVVISVQRGVIYHVIWKHRRCDITWYITCDEEAHAWYIAWYIPCNMVWYILELCLWYTMVYKYGGIYQWWYIPCDITVQYHMVYTMATMVYTMVYTRAYFGPARDSGPGPAAGPAPVVCFRIQPVDPWFRFRERCRSGAVQCCALKPVPVPAVRCCPLKPVRSCATRWNAIG